MTVSTQVEIANKLHYWEVMCPCCEKGPIKLGLLKSWELLRILLNHPISVISGYRCPAHNAEIGGSPTSRHLEGMALDIACKGYDLYSKDAFRAFINAGFKGIGRSKSRGICHLDVRPRHTFWTYTDSGTIPDREAMKWYSEIVNNGA